MKKQFILLLWQFILLSPISGFAQNCDTSAVGIDWSWPAVFPPNYYDIEFSCLDSSVMLGVRPRIACSSVAADGSNFTLFLPDGVLLKPISATAKNCIGDSSGQILIDFGRALFTNMRAPFLVGVSTTGEYIMSACAKRPWTYDSLAIIVQDCFVTDLNIMSIDQNSATKVEINWFLDSGTVNAPFPWYLFSSYQIYRRIGFQGQFQFLDSINHIDSTRYQDKGLPSEFIGTLQYVVSAKLQNQELDFDTASVYVVSKTSSIAYPNPFQSQLELALGGDGENEVEIFTQQGVLVYTTKIAAFHLVLPTHSWPRGIYFIRVRGKTETIQKVIKL